MSPVHARILLVERDASVQRALGRIFSSAGFEWRSFTTGEEFLAAEQDLRDACVVSDTSLPGIGGLELLRRVALRHPGVPFILLTSEGDEETRNKARSAGASALFRKPVDAEALLDSIRWAMHPPSHAATP